MAEIVGKQLDILQPPAHIQEAKKAACLLSKETPSGEFGMHAVSYCNRSLIAAVDVFSHALTENEAQMLKPTILIAQSTAPESIMPHLHQKQETPRKAPPRPFAALPSIPHYDGAIFESDHWINRRKYLIQQGEKSLAHPFALSSCMPFVFHIYKASETAIRKARGFLERASVFSGLLPNQSHIVFLSRIVAQKKGIEQDQKMILEDLERLKDHTRTLKLTDSQTELVFDVLLMLDRKADSQEWENNILLPLIRLVLERQWEYGALYRNALYAHSPRMFPSWKRGENGGGLIVQPTVKNLIQHILNVGALPDELVKKISQISSQWRQ